MAIASDRFGAFQLENGNATNTNGQRIDLNGQQFQDVTFDASSVNHNIIFGENNEHRNIIGKTSNFELDGATLTANTQGRISSLRSFSQQILDDPMGISVVGNKMYITDDDLDKVFVYDITDPLNPVRLINEDFGEGIINNAINIQIDNNIAYVLESNFPSIIHHFDISEPSNPIYLPEFSIQFNGFFDGFFFEPSNNKIYIANRSQDRVDVYDVSNKINPVELLDERITDAVLSNPRAITVNISANRLYISDSTNDGVYSFDITDSLNPVRVTAEDIVYATAATPESLQVVNNKLYVLDTVPDVVRVYDVSVLGTITELTTEQINLTSSTSYEKLFVTVNRVYVSNSTRRVVEAVDITTPTTPVLLQQETVGLREVTSPFDICVRGTKMYVADNGEGKVIVYDISDINNRVRLDAEEIDLGITNSPRAIDISGDLLFAVGRQLGTSSPNSIVVYDISTPTSPQLISTFANNEVANIRTIVVNGEKLLALDTFNSLFVYDISDLTLVTRLPAEEFDFEPFVATSTTLEDMVLFNDKLYVSDDRSDQILVLDISTPTNPTLLTAETVGLGILQRPYGVTIRDNILYVADAQLDRIVLFDISNPTAPVEVQGTRVDIDLGFFFSMTSLEIVGETVFGVNSNVGVINANLTSRTLMLGSKMTSLVPNVATNPNDFPTLGQVQSLVDEYSREFTCKSDLGLINQTVAFEPFFIRESIPNVDSTGTWTVVIPEDGDYLFHLSFRYSINTTGSDFLAHVLFDGVDFEIPLHIETKDAAGTGISFPTVAGGILGANLNTGTNQFLLASGDKFISNLSAGDVKTFRLEFANQVAETEAAIYEAYMSVRRVIDSNI